MYLLNIDGSGNSTQFGTLLISGITCTSTLNVSGLTTLNSRTLVVGNYNSYPNLQSGSTNGHNLGVATSGAFSSTSCFHFAAQILYANSISKFQK